MYNVYTHISSVYSLCCIIILIEFDQVANSQCLASMYISVLEYVICHYEVEVIHLSVHIAIEHVQ